ncbi:MAG: hypothetical protein KDE15_06245 [Erythrobacter sp.]|nr:hypothetical protein [Erythrobacter sp.]
MLRLSLVLVAPMTLLAACGGATSEAADAAFDENFTQSCVSSATAGGTVPTEVATEYCDCALARINEQYSASEKLSLTQEQAQPIMMQCVAQVQGNG